MQIDRISEIMKKVTTYSKLKSSNVNLSTYLHIFTQYGYLHNAQELDRTVAFRRY